MPDTTEPRPASTVVLLRPGPDGPEVLLTRRPETMAFAAGVHVFPGGAVDPADIDERLVRRSVLSPEVIARAFGDVVEPLAAFGHAVAAIRELHEEAGVLLADVGGAAATSRDEAGSFVDVVERFGLRLRTDLLVPLGRFVTPPILPRRFDTRFFAAELPPGTEPRFDPSEVVDHVWLTPAAAIRAMASGEIGLWLPTATMLLRLEQVRSLEDVRGRLAPRRPGLLRVEVVADGIRRIVQPSGAGVPGLTVQGYVVGERQHVAIDPGDPSEAVFRAFTEPGRVVGVVVTAPEPERIAGAEGMAIRLGVPIFAPAGASARLPFPVTELAPGEAVPVGDRPVTLPFDVPAGAAATERAARRAGSGGG